MYIFVQNNFIMKKVLAIAFIGALALSSCKKTETAAESNTMLAEPDTTVMMDSSATGGMVDSTAVVAPATDSTMAK